MKKSIIAVLIALPLMAAWLNVSAVPANPNSFKVIQPDGTALTIRVHGDEFLNWTTCGNSLVAKGEDGYYHYATFDNEGVSPVLGAIVRTTTGGDGSSVRPPASALKKAYLTRQAWTESARAIKKAAAERYSITGEDNFLVMLIDFSDLQFTVENAHNAFSNLLNQNGYSEYGGTGSVRDYFTDQSNGRFKPTFDLCGPYTVDGKMSSYSGSNGLTQNGAPRLLVEACKIADPDVDFSQYDKDKDGVIDNVFFYYAGHNSAAGNPGTIWPHSWAVAYGTFKFDGVQLYGYACASEYDDQTTSGRTMASIGTFCHEFAHTIGLPDFYDTDYEEGGEGYGLGRYSLMSHGCYNNSEKTPPYFNCEERMLLGWMDFVPSMPQKTRTLTLEPVQGDNGYVSPTGNDNEYYYYEYRNSTGWDAPLAPGLVIYHVDKSNNVVDGYTAAFRWENWDGINAYAAHECFKIMIASQSRGVVPFSEKYPDFNYSTTPAAEAWDGTATGYDLSQITHDGKKASFYLNCASADIFSEHNLCAIETGANLKAGDVFEFRLVEIENAPSSVKWYYDCSPITSNSVVLTSGEHVIEVEVKWANGDSGFYSAIINVK